MNKNLLNKEWIDNLEFEKIANMILNNCYLVIGKSYYRICEIEMYLMSSKHKDRYVHCSDDQKQYQIFYFHKFPNGSFKGGTFKGCDLAFGNEKDNIFFGILLRSICNKDTDEFIGGPCKVVNEMLEKTNYNHLKELTKNNPNLSIFNKKGSIRIEADPSIKDKEMFKGPRIGLSDKYPDFKLRHYRYLTDYKRVKKGKKSLVRFDL